MRIDPNTGAMALGVTACGPVFDPITMTAISVGLTALGAGVTAAGTIAAGNQAKADSDFAAKQLEMKANEERAIGQRRMFAERRQGELAQSRLRSVAAAASGDTTDPTIVNLASDIEGESEMSALSQFWAGENAARGYEDQAMAARVRGKAAKSGSRFAALGTILESGGSLAGKYGSMSAGKPGSGTYGYGVGGYYGQGPYA